MDSKTEARHQPGLWGPVGIGVLVPVGRLASTGRPTGTRRLSVVSLFFS